MLMKKVKHSIVIIFRKYHLVDSGIYKFLSLLNTVLYHKDEKMLKRNYGKENPEITFYVIRRHSKEEGLISMYFSILGEVEWAQNKGYIPFVDLQHNKTQYTTGEIIYGTQNAWEYFWEQPSEYDIDKIYKSRNVILSGQNRSIDVEIMQGKISQLIKNYDFSDSVGTHQIYEFIKEYADVKSYIYDKVEKIWNEKFDGKEIIGVFARGTDYISFQPKGHPVQPTKEQIYEQLMKMRQRFPESKVFLVTEDENIYKFFKDRLQTVLIEIEDIRFSNYKGDDYIFKYCVDNTYQIGLIYLIKLLLLSKCQYIVASITNGSKFANIMNDNHYKERWIIDLGVYP